MPHTYDELMNMTVTQLRTIADGIEHEATKGHSIMHKEQLLPALCTALGIEAHAHHHVVGIDKAGLKSHIRKLKTDRTSALEKHDYIHLRVIRREIHDLKRTLRRFVV